MKKRLWNRLLIALCGLITAAFGATLFSYGAGFFNNTGIVVNALSKAFAAYVPGFQPNSINWAELFVPFSPWQRTAIIALGLVFVVIGLYSVCELFRRNREKGFIIQHAEHGDMSISMNALENMVKKCVQTHSELTAGNTRIVRMKDGVSVSLKVTLSGGANIPLTVSALQKQIKQYITSCSGVDVKEVRVMVETNVSKLEPPVPVEVDDVSSESAVSEHEEPRVRSILSHVEEPSTYAEEAPVFTEEAATADEPEEQAVTSLEQSSGAEVSETDKASYIIEAFESNDDNEHTEQADKGSEQI